MRNRGKNILIKATLMLCVVMQVVALTPHHHHGGTDIVCLNYTHVAAENQCDDVCHGEHEHEAEHPYTSCSSYNIVIARPEVRENEIENISSDLPDCGCGVCVADYLLAAVTFRTSLIEQEIDTHPDTESYIRIYITNALPCRAPDFTA